MQVLFKVLSLIAGLVFIFLGANTKLFIRSWNKKSISGVYFVRV